MNIASENINVPYNTSKVQNSKQSSLLDDPIMTESSQEYNTLIPITDSKKRYARSSTL